MKNAIEDAVRDIYRSLREKNAQFCGCARCEDDVIAYALNHTRPRYVAGPPMGAAVTSAQLAQDQSRAELTVVVFDAMRRVAKQPRHQPPE